MIEALAEALTRPIVGYPPWHQVTPQQKIRIKIERMKQVMESKGKKIELATDYEAMIYISTASLSQPLSRMWTRIYCHLFKTFYPDQSDFLPDYEAKLHIQDEQELLNLKRWLWKKSRRQKK